MPRPRKLTTVVAAGDHRQSLEALRDRLAAEVEQADGRTLAPLAKQLADVLKALAAIPTGREETLDDELAKQRARRRSSSRTSDGPTVKADTGRGSRRSGGGRRAGS